MTATQINIDIETLMIPQYFWCARHNFRCDFAVFAIVSHIFCVYLLSFHYYLYLT